MNRIRQAAIVTTNAGARDNQTFGRMVSNPETGNPASFSMVVEGNRGGRRAMPDGSCAAGKIIFVAC